MSLKNTEKLVNLEGLTTYTQMLNVKQEAQNNKIVQIIGELAGATAQLTKTTAKVDCDHRYEITGATNDEHNLAIEDQQMLINKISGRTLVRNQLINPSEIYLNNIDDPINWSVDEDGILTLNSTGTKEESDILFYIHDKMNYQKYSQIFVKVEINQTLDSSIINIFDAYNGIFLNNGGSTIYSISNNSNRISWRLTIKPNKTVSNLQVKFSLMNLSLAYGVGNEPTTVEEVLNDFPEYIPYDEGTFVHSNNKLISTGKNLWKYGDVSGTQYVEVALDTPIKAGRYTISAFVESTDTDNTISVVNYSDKDSKTFAEAIYNRNETLSRTITFIKDVYFVKFYASDTWNNGAGDKFSYKNFQIEYGEVATEYEPYKEEVIKGVGELKAFDYVDNETDNTIYGSGEINLGTIDGWTYYEGYDGFYNPALSSFFNENMVMPLNSDNIPYAITQRYMRVGDYNFSNLDTTTDLVFTINVNGMIKIRDKSCNGDANLLKQALQGVKLLYKKTNPTIVENDNLPAGMSVYKGGLQEQQGTIPYVIEKQYALSIASQVVQNIEIDREQQKQIDNMKVDIDHKQPLLFSGQNIKTFNGQSMLGSGDLAWNDPMFLAKFNNVTDYVNENSGIIDELLEGKTYRIYSDNDASSSVYSFNVRLKLKISSGETKMYTITLPTKTKNFVDFRLDNIVLNGQTATLYYNVDNVDYIQTLTQQGDAVVGDYEIYGWGALSLSGTYASVFEPVELVTKADLLEVKPIQSIKEIFTVGERGEISISQMPILTRPIYMFNKTKGNRYYLFIDLVSYTIVCRKNGVQKNPDEVFYSLTIDSENDIKDICFIQGEYSDGDIIEVIYEYGYIDPTIFIEI